MEGDILFKRLGIFKSILISYVLITLLPISVFMYITATNFTRSYRSSIIENRMANLDRVQAMLDLRLRECKSLAGQISQNTYGNTAQKSRRDTVRSDIIRPWINR